MMQRTLIFLMTLLLFASIAYGHKPLPIQTVFVGDCQAAVINRLGPPDSVSRIFTFRFGSFTIFYQHLFYPTGIITLKGSESVGGQIKDGVVVSIRRIFTEEELR